MSRDPAPNTADLPRCSASEGLATATAELKHGNWAAALAGFLEVRSALKQQTPRLVYAHAATCLHRLGRYTEAEELSREGLGAQRELIAIEGVVPNEKELTRHWRTNAAPTVSILCTTYNHERYIESAIRGFLSQQTKFSFEIIVHDDASNDGTAEIVRAWQKKYPSLFRAILQTENQFSRGVCPLALCLQQARGDYVAVCEGDDYWIDPAKLEKQVGFLEQHADFSCSAHNYYLYNETQLAVRPWFTTRTDRILSARQLMTVSRLLWLPTLVFRKTFSSFPPERRLAPIGDQFLTSYLGTFGKAAYFETFLGAVRRENQYSVWTPLSDAKKESIRVQTWLALVRLHRRLGNEQAVADLRQRIEASPLHPAEKLALVGDALSAVAPQPLEAIP